MGTELVAGRFALVDPIGYGGTGAVWRAFDHRQGRYCAVKVMRQLDAGTLLRVVREQGIRLNHPHVLSPYAWVVDDSVLIATDLAFGGSLTALVRRHGALPDGYVATIVDQLLDALDHVHAEGLLHRDVKPSNVLLDATGTGAPRVRLGDFGIALPVTGARLTQSGHVIGTPGYLAPELLDGSFPDVRQDLYGLGVTAWQLATGTADPPREPVAGGECPAGTAPRLWDYIQRLMAIDPDQRPLDAAAARNELADLAIEPPAGGQPIDAIDVVGPLPYSWGPQGRIVAAPHRLGRIAALGALVAAAVAVGGIASTVLFNAAAPTEPASKTSYGPASPAGATTTAPVIEPLPGVSRSAHRLAGVGAGQTCAWQDVGTIETTTDGNRLQCTYAATDRYAWRPL